MFDAELAREACRERAARIARTALEEREVQRQRRRAAEVTLAHERRRDYLLGLIVLWVKALGLGALVWVLLVMAMSLEGG
jgi:hypothetical protein